MIDSLVKVLLENKPSSETKNEGMEDLVQGYKDFEKVCSIWNTFIYLNDSRAENQFVYVSPTFCSYIGLDYQEALKGGFKTILPFIHPNDLKIIETIIFKRTQEYLASKVDNDSSIKADYKLSYNFRIKVKEGNYVNLSIVSKILQFDTDGTILMDFGLIAPVNYVLRSDKIIFNISKSTNEVDYTSEIQEEFNPDAYPKFSLTEREWEIVELIKKGLNTKDMAKQLFLSDHTIKNHRKNILRKTNTNKVTELLLLLNTLGL